MANLKDCSKTNREKNTGLKKCFSALVDRKQVNLELDVLKLMLKHELQINTETLDENLSSVLPFMLALYIKNWPGWQRSKEYYSGKLNFKDWFEKFRQYIVVRLNYLIKNGYNLAIEMLREDMKKEKSAVSNEVILKSQDSQTDYLMPKSVAPFTISIECPPKLMGSLIFTENGEDLIIKSHPEIPWTKIGIKELLNWPHISVEFKSPELSFKRKNCGEYFRFVNLNNSYIPIPKDSDFIEQIDIVDQSNVRTCYSVNLLKAYANEYVNLLKNAQGIKKEVEVIELVLEEFLKDIEDFEINQSMATNTSVLFNIGKSTFLRNKKLSKNITANTYYPGSKLEICYSELFVPKMETTLYYFKGVQDLNTPEISFSYLNIMKTALANKNNCPTALGYAMPNVQFICEFCNEKFDVPAVLMDHLERLHKMEPSYICRLCMKSCPINQLSAKRWKHNCPDLNNKLPPAIASRTPK